MILTRRCKRCGIAQKESRSLKLATEILITLECGHSYTQKMIVQNGEAVENLESDDGKKLYPFQVAGVQAAEKANGRFLIADEMGLGKTAQACGFIALHKKEVLPCVIVVKSSLLWNWSREITDWTDLACQVLSSRSDTPAPGFKVYITTYDLLTDSVKTVRKEKVPVPGLAKKFEEIDLKLAILDECQQIKSTEASRTNATRNLVRNIPYLLAMSGTPIMNSAAEYFTVLNLLDSNKFSGYQNYVDDWLDESFNGYTYKIGGIRALRIDAWKKYTENLIIRRTRNEVLPDLPKIRRLSSIVDLGDTVKEAYETAMTKFMEAYEETGTARTMNMLIYMNLMRQIVGIAKVPMISEYLTDFVEQTDRKIVVFTHHIQVMDMLANRYPDALVFHSGLSAEERQALVDKFRTGDSRIMIASTGAAGEGINMQFCHDAIMAERQWNPAREEQAEGRFSRIGSESDHVDVTYYIASSTIDEYFAEIVERKRGYMKSTLDGEITRWDESSLMSELADKLASSGKTKWRLVAQESEFTRKK